MQSSEHHTCARLSQLLLISCSLDLGNVNPATNIFLNSTAFQQRIFHDPFMSNTAPLVIGQPRPDKGVPYTPEEFWTTCTWGWGCLNGTWTDALLSQDPKQSISKGLPLDDFDGPLYATVIDVKYVCPVFRVKRIGALLVSVFIGEFIPRMRVQFGDGYHDYLIGTFSMYTALYGIFLFITPKVDEWYRKKRGLRRFSMGALLVHLFLAFALNHI
jgi:hypothetical protein